MTYYSKSHKSWHKKCLSDTLPCCTNHFKEEIVETEPTSKRRIDSVWPVVPDPFQIVPTLQTQKSISLLYHPCLTYCPCTALVLEIPGRQTSPKISVLSPKNHSQTFNSQSVIVIDDSSQRSPKNLIDWQHTMTIVKSLYVTSRGSMPRGKLVDPLFVERSSCHFRVRLAVEIDKDRPIGSRTCRAGTLNFASALRMRVWLHSGQRVPSSKWNRRTIDWVRWNSFPGRRRWAFREKILNGSGSYSIISLHYLWSWLRWGQQVLRTLLIKKSWEVFTALWRRTTIRVS